MSVDGGMEGRITWRETDAIKTGDVKNTQLRASVTESAPSSIHHISRHRVRIALSVDFDAVSGWLGTGQHADNNMADYSSGIFAGKVGVPRLVSLFQKLGIAEKVTWFIPGHSMESFPVEVQQIVDSGCEIALHGYSHEVRHLNWE